jgi:hypothetical protein
LRLPRSFRVNRKVSRSLNRQDLIMTFQENL